MQNRTLSLLTLAVAGLLFLDLFVHWLAVTGRTVNGWTIPLVDDVGLLALALAIVEKLRVLRLWNTRGSELLAFGLTAATAVLGLAALVNLRWGDVAPGGFGPWTWGAWIAFVLAALLAVLSVFRWLDLRAHATTL